MTRDSNRLLVVDDQSDILEFVGTVAEGVGYRVETALNAATFRALLASFSPTLLILDLQMPDTDGVELIRELARQGSRAQILISSGMDSRVLASAEQLGLTHGLAMIGTLQKPIMLADLEALLTSRLVGTAVPTEMELRRAVDRGQLVAQYQPQVALESGGIRVVGVESLVRWQHPDLGLIYPDDFITLAEDTGLIGAVTDFVLQEGIRQLGVWRSLNIDLGLAVNLSPHLVRDLDFPDRLSDLMRGYGVPNESLTLEITETAALADPARTRDILTRLRVKNFGLSLDDFGTGYSSLTQLYQMPFNELKIDRSLGAELQSSREARTIVRSIVELAHNLGLSVCTEGIEQAAALEFLCEARCDRAQGFYVGRPVPAAGVPAAIAGIPQSAVGGAAVLLDRDVLDRDTGLVHPVRLAAP